MRVTDPAFLQKLSITPQTLGGIFYAIPQKAIEVYDPANEEGINVVKNFLKKWPSAYEFTRAIFSPGLSLNFHYSPHGAVNFFYKDADLSKQCIVSIGSGTKWIHPDVVQMDIYPLPNVTLVADARELPFKDGSVDMIICEAVLEHIADAQKVISEIKRVLKPGGHIYISVPFVYPFHASPNDFHRWSIPGLTAEFEGFSIEKKGMRAGPAAALQGILMHLCSLVLSLGWYPLYHAWAIFFMFVFSPLKLLDPILSILPNSTDIAADIYIMATKKS